MTLDLEQGEREERSALVRLRGIAKSYGGITALAPLDLEVRQGDFLSILGPSGCGKSTLLRIIAGFAEPSAGRVEIAGLDVTALGPEKRPTNMVFQGYGLFPHMTVRQNIAFGLVVAKRPKAEIARRVEQFLQLVQLEPLADRLVDQLSGGQQQRVALARALVMQPKVLLLDEPLAALDLKLRQAMQEELRRIHAEIGGTFIFVTHDQDEALNLSTRIAVMNRGRVEQLGSPEEVYLRPASLFVATFVGESNLLPGTLDRGLLTLEGGQRLKREGADGPVTALIRPEAILLVEGEAAPPALTLPVTVESVVFLGEVVKCSFRTAAGRQLVMRRADPTLPQRLHPGQAVTLGWSPEAMLLLPGAE